MFEDPDAGGLVLYDMTDKKLAKVPTTTFAEQAVMERAHLQAAIRDQIDVLGDDLLVVAEEFGDFEGVNRRIDLLAVDRTGRLVVIELKRTRMAGTWTCRPSATRPWSVR